MPRRAMPSPASRSIRMCDGCSLDPCAFPRIGRVAAVALGAIFTEVAVILVVTAPAQRRGLYRARRFVMTVGALQLGVGARQSKVSLLRMIESPQRPTVRRMTALAFLTETALVHVIMRMAIDAGLRRSVEGQCRMAL